VSITLVQVIVSGLLLGAVYALFSSGLTLIWGMMNVVNFAHGDFVMLGMYAAVMVWTALGGGPFAAVPVAAMLIATLGVLSYLLLVRHHHARADAGADPGHLRSGAVPALRRLLDLRRRLQDLARYPGRRLLHPGRHPLRGLSRAGRRHGPGGHSRPPPDPDAHLRRQSHAGGVGGRDGSAAHGYPPTAHAGAGLGHGGRRDRHRGAR